MGFNAKFIFKYLTNFLIILTNIFQILVKKIDNAIKYSDHVSSLYYFWVNFLRDVLKMF